MTNAEREQTRGYEFCSCCWQNVRPVRRGKINKDWLCEYCTASLLSGRLSSVKVLERQLALRLRQSQA